MMNIESSAARAERKPAAPPEAPQKERKLPKEYVLEKQRRAEVARTVSRAAELDHEFFNRVRTGGPLHENIERLESVESLTFGTELGQETVGEAGVNAITRRTYEGDPPRIAYVKPQLGEASLRWDPATRRVIETKRHLAAGGSRVESTETVVGREDGDEAERLYARIAEYKAEQRQELKQRIAECYGIAPEDVPLHDTEMTHRQSVDTGKLAKREYTVSRINELVGFGVVPLTVLRAEKNDADLLSVQEAVRSKDPDAVPREMDKALYESVRDLGPKHPGAKSFMRIACLDYLVKSHDRHPGNLLYTETYDEENDEFRGEFTAIDNGLSLGLSESRKVTEGGKEKTVTEPVDAYWSVPMEVVQDHPDWELDDEAVEQLKSIYKATTDYLAFREKIIEKRKGGKPASEDLMEALEAGYQEELERMTGGKEIKFVTGLFRFLHDNEKIAQREGLEFFKKIDELIRNRRPPKLPVGSDQGNALTPVRKLYHLEA